MTSYRPSPFFTTFALLLILLFSPALSSPSPFSVVTHNTARKAPQCIPPQLTHARCNTTADCSQSVTTSQCWGRPNPNAALRPCPDPSVSFCRCIPLSTHYCVDDRDCLDQEYCAISRRSGNALCVACATLSEPNSVKGFDPVSTSSSRARCYDNGKSEPPCGYANDLCSPSLPCQSDYECVSDVEGRFFSCGWESRRCTCVRRDTLTEDNKDLPKKCEDDGDCPLQREVCARYTTRNETRCASCDDIRLSNDLVHHPQQGTTNKCTAKTFKKRPVPRSYIEGPNGRTMDRCLTSLHCTGDSRCVTQELIFSPTTGDFQTSRLADCRNRRDRLCFCLPNPSRRPQSCTTGTDCAVGESCITLLPGTGFDELPPPVRLTRRCASNALFDTLSTRQYIVIGERARSPTNGSLVTGDECRFDWECKGEQRRCTHRADVFGRCAGRINCVCKPLVSPACAKHADCHDAGEQCVTARDASFQPFCMSVSATSRSPYYFPIDSPLLLPQLDSTPTPVPTNQTFGLTRDPCLTSADCISPRKCFHRFDIPVLPSPDSITRCDASGGTLRECICAPPLGTPGQNCSMSHTCGDIREVCVMLKQQVPGGRAHRRCVSSLAVDMERSIGVNTTVEFGPRKNVRMTQSALNSDVENTVSNDNTVRNEADQELSEENDTLLADGGKQSRLVKDVSVSGEYGRLEDGIQNSRVFRMNSD